MFPGNENKISRVVNSLEQLQRLWPDYQKPADSLKLSQKFKLEDVLRVAKTDPEINNLLSTIGLK